MSRQFGVSTVSALSLLGVVVGGIVTFFLFTSKAGTPPPIKVGGGAIGFLTDSAHGPWTEEGPGYCMNLAVAKIAILGADPETAGSPTNWTRVSSFSMTVDGALPGTSPPTHSSNGVAISETNTACGGGNGTAIHLGPVGNAAFYPQAFFKQLRGKDGSWVVRFQDTSPAPQNPNAPSCRGPNGNPNGDEDACEQLTRIVSVTVNGSSSGDYSCQNPYCTIELRP